MIKAVVFDLDGVLVDTDELHFHALNEALLACGVDPLSWQEHMDTYRARPTKTKLEMMSEIRGLPRSLHAEIRSVKAERTNELIARSVRPDTARVEVVSSLRERYPVAVCSNAIRSSVQQMLAHGGYLPHVSFFLSAEDVAEPKPSPSIYLRAAELLNVDPGEMLVVEDSPLGAAAALNAGARILRVKGPMDVTKALLDHTLADSERITVVVPAAGLGSRFQERGYTRPKPLIDVLGRPMICHAIDDFEPLSPALVVLLQRDAILDHRADEILRSHYSQITTVPVNGLTEGAACTVLLAEREIAAAGELLLANSDQKVDASISEFVLAMRARRADGGILVFRASDPKWSYARADANGLVSEVAEKRPISELATVGIYYFRRGSDFVRSARRMIERDIRTNGEFYVCPVFNELIETGGRVYVHEIDAGQMHGLGTPDDLGAYLSWHAKREQAVAA